MMKRMCWEWNWPHLIPDSSGFHFSIDATRFEHEPGFYVTLLIGRLVLLEFGYYAV